jgi:hypothetical protein
MFGDTACLVTIVPDAEPVPPSRYKARVHVLGYRSLTMRAVADRHGTPVAFTADSEQNAFAIACDYLEDRFGPRRAAPAPTTSYLTTRIEEQPPVLDERPDPIMVVALEDIRRGDSVVVTREGARRARRHVRRSSLDKLLAIALDDIEKGQQGRVREITDAG